MSVRPLLIRAAGAVVGLFLILFLLGGEARTLWTLPAVTLVFLGLHFQARWSARGRAAFLAFLAGTGVAFGARIAATIAANSKSIPVWDYLGFWLHARSAVLGRSFYDPANARILAAPYNVGPGFTEEIINAGFWYPPPSMFLFLPLGWFDPMTALPFWYAFNGLAAAFVVVLLWKSFVPAGGAAGWLACATLVCANHGTETTFRFSQTNFVALLALLLFWRRRSTAAGGAWALGAFLVKPFLGVLLLQPILGGKRRVLAGVLLSAAALMLASAVAFGPGTFFDYFTRDHIGGKPDWIYDQPTNQSLLGLVLRATGAECSGAACVTNPIFLAGAAALGLMTLALGVGLQRAREEEWALSLYLLLGLIVYPVSQLFYGPLLLPPLLLAWRHRERVAGGAWTASIVVATVFALAALHDGTATVFAYLLTWVVMALTGMRLVQGGGWPLRPVAGRNAITDATAV